MGQVTDFLKLGIRQKDFPSTLQNTKALQVVKIINKKLKQTDNHKFTQVISSLA